MKTLKRFTKKMGWEGLKLYTFKKLKRPKLFEISLPNKMSRVVLRNRTTDIKVFKQIFINECYAFDLEVEPKIIVDAGAYTGLSSLYFASRYCNAKIFSLEPEPSNFELLINNTKDYKNIQPLNSAIWNKDELLDIVDCNVKKYAFSFESSQSRLEGTKGITIPSLMNDNNIQHIDILKLDIEGAEKELFAHHPNWIKDVGLIIIELHDRIVDSCSDTFYKALDGFQYTQFSKGENVFIKLGTRASY